jgi:hypothetical protein
MPSLFGSGIAGGLTGLDGSLTVPSGGGGVGIGSGLISQHQVAPLVNPRNGQRPIDANQVRANDVAIATAFNAHDANSTVHVQSSTTGARPAPGVSGRKWFTADDTLVLGWLDTGTQWLPLTVAWGDLLNRPSTFPPSAHTHPTSAVVGLDAALGARAVLGADATFAALTASSGVVSGVLELGSRQLRAGSRTYVWPAADGASGQTLTTDGAGALSWVTPAGGGGGGSVDWTAITGRPSTFAPSAHTHSPSELTAGALPAGVTVPAGQITNGLLSTGVTVSWSSLDGGPATFPPAAHTQAWSTITGTPPTFPSDWNTTINRPATFTPSPHRHGWAELDNIPATFAPSAHTHPWSEVTAKPTTFPPSAHTHVASDITNLSTAISGKADLGGVANFSVLTVNGTPVASLIVSESPPSGAAAQNTFWVQV